MLCGQEMNAMQCCTILIFLFWEEGRTDYNLEEWLLIKYKFFIIVFIYLRSEVFILKRQIVKKSLFFRKSCDSFVCDE